MVAVPCVEREMGEAAEVDVDMGGGDLPHVIGEAILPRYLAETSQGPGVGLEGVGGLALHLTAHDVEVAKALQTLAVVAVAVASSQHRSTTDILARVACVVYVYIALVGKEVKWFGGGLRLVCRNDSPCSSGRSAWRGSVPVGQRE